MCRFQWRQDYVSATCDNILNKFSIFLYFLRGRGSMVRWCDLNWSILSLLLWLETLFLKYTFLPNDDRLSIDAACPTVHTHDTGLRAKFRSRISRRSRVHRARSDTKTILIMYASFFGSFTIAKQFHHVNFQQRAESNIVANILCTVFQESSPFWFPQ